MSKTCTQTDWDAAGDIRSVEIWSFTQTGSPHDHGPHNSNDQLSSCDEPVGMNHIRRLFVVNIVKRVAYKESVTVGVAL